ncbi:MAG: hypothetical protein KDB61_06820 [Planctomycetes bacterium]|nr:hypothetical protein [Planctomycetota bacterium]
MKRRGISWLLALMGLVGLSTVFWPGMPSAGRTSSPLVSLAASWQWVLFDQSVGRGEFEQAYLHADRALALDPGAPEGWTTLANHLIFLRGSFQNEPDDAKRIEWMRAGLDVLFEGLLQSRDPGELHLVLGQTLTLYIAPLAAAEVDPLPWPGGAQAAQEQGMDHLHKALELHHPRAAKVLSIVDGAHDHDE